MSAFPEDATVPEGEAYARFRAATRAHAVACQAVQAWSQEEEARLQASRARRGTLMGQRDQTQEELTAAMALLSLAIAPRE